MSKIVVVGASLGGLRALEALRRQGWHDDIVLVGDEPHMPYSRPPLSKKVLSSGGTLDDVLLRQQPSDLPTEWRLGVEAVSSDLAARTITLSDGTTIGYDGLVVATGVRARRLPSDVAHTRRHVLRTVDDSIAVSAALIEGARVVIVGAGFIGCEVAAVARARGCDVSVVAIDEVPMLVPLGAMVGAEIQRRHEDSGITFHLGRTVERFEETSDGAVVVLDDGTYLVADLVLEAIGSEPSTEWLAGNGLDLANGVLCDDRMRPLAADGSVVGGAVAVGDVARFPHPLVAGGPRRIEHWHIPGDSARVAAAALLHELVGPAEAVAPVFEALPTFWSHQGSASIRSFGSPATADEVSVIEGDLQGDVAIGYSRDGRLVGAVLIGMASQSGRYLQQVTAAGTEARAQS